MVLFNVKLIALLVLCITLSTMSLSKADGRGWRNKRCNSAVNWVPGVRELNNTRVVITDHRPVPCPTNPSTTCATRYGPYPFLQRNCDAFLNFEVFTPDNSGPNGWPSGHAWGFSGQRPTDPHVWAGGHVRVRGFNYLSGGSGKTVKGYKPQQEEEYDPKYNIESSIKTFFVDADQHHGKYRTIATLTVEGHDIDNSFASTIFQVFSVINDKDSSIEAYNCRDIVNSKLIIKQGKVYYSGVFNPDNLTVQYSESDGVAKITVSCSVMSIVEYPGDIDTNSITELAGADAGNLNSMVPEADFDIDEHCKELPQGHATTQVPYTVKISPNPVKDYFHFFVHTTQSLHGQIVLTDARGREVWATYIPDLQPGDTFTGEVPVTHDMPSGIYVLRTITNVGIVSKQVVLQR